MLFRSIEPIAFCDTAENVKVNLFRPAVAGVNRLHQELPYSAMVEGEKWEEREDGSVRIDQVIYVRRDGQKAIVLGKGGAQIKAIGAAARQELEKLLERPVHLFLFVKVREDWPDDRQRYNDMGLEYDA